MINEIKTSGFKSTIMQYVGDNNNLERVYCYFSGPISNVIFDKGIWRFNITVNDGIRLCCGYYDENKKISFQNGDIIEAVGITVVRRIGYGFTVTYVPLLDVKLSEKHQRISEIIIINPRTKGTWIYTGKKETEAISVYQSILIDKKDVKLEDTTTYVVGSFARKAKQIIMKIEHWF